MVSFGCFALKRKLSALADRQRGVASLLRKVGADFFHDGDV